MGSTLNFLAANRQLRLSSLIADAVVTWESDFSLGGAGNRTINVINNPASAADWAVISGNISGAGNLVKLGAPLHLLGNNSFTGFLHVATGQVFVNTLENASVPSGAGAGSEIRLGQAGKTGNFVYTGTGQSSNRTWRLVGTTGGGQITAQGSGALVLTGNASILAGSAKTLTLQGNSTSLNTFSGQISNGAAALSVFKKGTGTWVLSGNNTYTGNTTLSAGTLLVGGNSTFGSGNFLMGAGTAGSHGGPRTIPNRTLLTANSQIGAGSSLTFSGNFINNAGSRTLTVNTGAYAYFTGNILLSESTTNRVLTLTGAGNSVVSGVIANGPSTASRLTKAGTGALVLTNNNTYSGNTTVSGGILEIRATSALGNASAPTLVASGATLSTNGTFTTNERLILAGAGVGSSGALRHIGGDVTFGGNVTLTGNTTISSEAGSLTFSPGSGDAITGSFALALSGSGNLTLVQRYNIGGAPLVKNGAGRVVLESTASPYSSGNVTLNAGIFEVNGTLASGGSLLVQSGARLEGAGTIQKPTTVSGIHSPGASSGVGSQTFSNSLSYSAGSTLEWQLLANTDTGPGTNFDQMLVTGGNLTIAGGTSISLLFNSSNSTVDWTNPFWDSSRQWTAISFSSSGSSLGNFTFVNLSVDSLGQSLSSARPGAVFQVSRAGNDIVVIYHLPEPTSVSLIAWGALALYFSRRRRAQTPRARGTS